MPEHGPCCKQLQHRRLGKKFMLVHRPYKTRCCLRPEGQRITAPVDECVHLLFNDISKFANTPSKNLGLFQQRNPYFFQTEGIENTAGKGLNSMPKLDLIRQYVLKSANSFYRHFRLLLWEFIGSRVQGFRVQSSVVFDLSLLIDNVRQFKILNRNNLPARL